jgi:DnaK suppressor protein
VSVTDAASPAAERALAAHDHATLLRAAERLLDDVDRALTSLDDGSYGTCERCGAAIDDGDLQEDPLVTACPQHRGPQGE